jgi:hypothetical protein
VPSRPATTLIRTGTVAVAVVTSLVVAASPASAHGLGERADLPLSLPFFLVGSAVAVVAAFAVTSWFWPRPRLADAATGRVLGRTWTRVADAVRVPLRVLGVALFALVLGAALFGADTTARNLAPVALYVWFWVGLQLASVVVGDVWRLLSPYATVAPAIGRTPRLRSPLAAWTAPALLFSFAWLELAYFDPSSPRAVGVWMLGYSVAVVVALACFGRGWLADGEGFAALFGLESHLAPLYRDPDGRLRLRPPLTGLATVEVRPSTGALVMVALGATAFDGVTGTTFWADVTRTSEGWTYALLNTVGLLWMIGLAGIVYLAATRSTAGISGLGNEEAARAFLPSLVPIVFGYVIAHYFSTVVFEGQLAIALISDPFGEGWNLFGTAGHTIDYGVVSERAVSWVQVGAIVAGHVAGVVVAHDRAVELFPRPVAVRSQIPLVAAMVVYTVGGLALLLG